MDARREQRETSDIARSFFLRTVGLSVAMLLPYAMLDGFAATLAALAIVGVYVIVAILVKNRGKPKPAPEERAGSRDRRTALVTLLYLGGGFLAMSGSIGTILFLWLGIAYNGAGGEPIPLGEDIIGAVVHSLTLLAGGLVALALAMLLLHWNRGGLAALSYRIRRYGIGMFLAPWLSGFATLTLLAGCLNLVATALPLEIVTEEMSLGRQAFFPDGFAMFPFVPLGMFATATMAVAWVDLSLDYESADKLLAALRDDEAPPPRDPWWRALVTIIFCAAAGILGAFIWTFHVALVAATASAPAMLTGIATAEAIDEWREAQEAAGRPIGEIVGTINEKGHWSTAEPDAGLPEFLPNLPDTFAEIELQRECRVTVAAAEIDPAEVAGIEWPEMPSMERNWTKRYGEDASDGEAERVAESASEEPDEPWEAPIRYCVRATCASPVAWDAPPAAFLYSSHPSANPDWMWLMFVDFFADGRAPGSAGYCNADGTLADRYQG